MASSENRAADPPPERSSRPWRRWLVRTAISVCALLVGGELFARFYLGLGDPPLLVADPDVEYMFKPNQDVRRFGNRIHYNAYSMRSDDFPKHKSNPHELRVLMLGDSVINGGTLTDQSQIASQILQQRLSEKLDRPVVVSNVSAASWGPANLLAYVKRFGWFDADVVVIVLSSHDYGDVPTFEPVVGVRPDFPDHKPLLALEEGFTRYLLPRLGAGHVANASLPAEQQPDANQISQGSATIRELINLAHATGARVIVAQHLESSEQAGPLKPGHDVILRLAREAGAEVVQLGPAEKAALDAGNSPYRDSIHPNAMGQRVIAEVLFDPIVEALTGRSTSQPASGETVDSRRTGG